jgi:hypothetical protein
MCNIDTEDRHQKSGRPFTTTRHVHELTEDFSTENQDSIAPQRAGQSVISGLECDPELMTSNGSMHARTMVYEQRRSRHGEKRERGRDEVLPTKEYRSPSVPTGALSNATASSAHTSNAASDQASIGSIEPICCTTPTPCRGSSGEIAQGQQPQSTVSASLPLDKASKANEQLDRRSHSRPENSAPNSGGQQVLDCGCSSNSMPGHPNVHALHMREVEAVDVRRTLFASPLTRMSAVELIAKAKMDALRSTASGRHDGPCFSKLTRGGCR